MGLESATYIGNLDVNNPAFNDPKSQGDDHLRLLKQAIKSTLPDLVGRFGRVQPKIANYQAINTDNSTVLEFTGAGPITLTTALMASLGNGWGVMVVNRTAQILTITPTAPELVNGYTTMKVAAGANAWLMCSGVAGNEFIGVLGMQGTATTRAPGDNSTFIATTAFVAAANAMSPITASLGADVLLTNSLNYFDGPSIAQGAVGTWFVSGTITVQAGSAGVTFYGKLWDGTTVIAATSLYQTTPGTNEVIALSGIITAPVGNLRISARNTGTNDGKIVANTSVNGNKDSTITAIRIA